MLIYLRAFLLLAAIAALLYAGDTSAKRINILRSAPYKGPGDVVSGAVVFYSYRCYSAAFTGNVADIWDGATGSTTETLLTCSAGGVVNQTINPLSTTCAVSCFVKTYYNQIVATTCSSSPCDLVQSTNANRPVLHTACVGSMGLCADYTSSKELESVGNATGTPSQPYWVTLIAKRTGSYSSQQTILTNSSSGTGFYFSATPDSILSYATGTTANVSNTDNAFHAIQGLFNAGSSYVISNGSAGSTANIGTGDFTSGKLAVNFGSQLNGEVSEIGVWSGTFSGGQITSMNTNMHAYGGGF